MRDLGERRRGWQSGCIHGSAPRATTEYTYRLIEVKEAAVPVGFFGRVRCYAPVVRSERTAASEICQSHPCSFLLQLAQVLTEDAYLLLERHGHSPPPPPLITRVFTHSKLTRRTRFTASATEVYSHRDPDQPRQSPPPC